MKKFGFKTRAQWEFFRSALIGILIGILIAPTAAGILNRKQSGVAEKKESVSDIIANLVPGEKTKVIINGKVVAIAKGQEKGEAAFKAARLAYNAEGVKLLNLNVTYEPVDKEKDAELVKSLHVKRDDELKDAILESLSSFDDGKELAYTMRIDNYTVTVERFQDLIAILEKAQGRYDENDRFQVELNQPASRNVTMYEVGVTEKAEKKEEPDETEKSPDDVTETPTDENTEVTTETVTESTEPTTETSVPETNTPETKPEDVEDNNQADNSEAVHAIKPAEVRLTGNEILTSQAAEDGVKYVGFSEKIQVMETYVARDQIKDSEAAYQEITTEKDETDIYVVKLGDILGLIAEKYGMSLEQMKELNPGIESDDNIYVDDRLNVKTLRSVVEVMVQKQETYEEDYNADVVYVDDASMFIGENVVQEEGSAGKHIVTDLVTYKGDTENKREQVKETVEVAAVAQVIIRGTKSRPTYMYPVTNWNITSNFGYRWGRLHAGTDVGIPTGTTVRASRGGKVSVAGWVGGYGNCVMIDHGDGITTVYGHLSEINCSVGQYVDQGQQIALSGNTGRSTGPHLHFEIRVNGVAEDAMPYLLGQK